MQFACVRTRHRSCDPDCGTQHAPRARQVEAPHAVLSPRYVPSLSAQSAAVVTVQLVLLVPKQHAPRTTHAFVEHVVLSPM